MPADPPATMRSMTRRSFATGAVTALAALGGWQWLKVTEREDNLAWPLRRVLGANQGIAEHVLGTAGLAPTFPATAALMPRVNGRFGLDGEIDAAGWQVQVESPDGRRAIALEHIQQLPRTELVTELKCIEGWSCVVAWSGVRLLDFMTHFALGDRTGRSPDLRLRAADLYPHVYLATPDRKYYVGLDAACAIHPQTLLCDRMNGEPLAAGHGAPLRLFTPVKYGIKCIKRIGLIRFQDERPGDYWAERGYDWFAGL